MKLSSKKFLRMAAATMLAATSGLVAGPRAAHAEEEGTRTCYYRTTTITTTLDGIIIRQEITHELMYCITNP